MTTVPTFTDPELGALPRDPDLDVLDEEADRGGDADPLAALAELAQPVDMPDVIVPHRFRPGWAVRYSTVLDSDDLKRWRKRATDRKGAKETVDETRMACIILANLCRALIRNGAEVLGPDEQPLTFAHPAVWKLYDAQRAADAVRGFYGNDPYLGATLEAVLAAAGVGEEVEPLDPTRPSSD